MRKKISENCFRALRLVWTICLQIVRNAIIDSKNCTSWPYPTGVPPLLAHAQIPDNFYCILDMDDGYMAFATDEHYLGVAFRNLQG
ncbi:hypothetical protein KIN20_011745 [Parelaphostrongylus tenuis]|uniref:B30.2/SPRY domain-containing protein n=1 Tax=Parelaphostrongylus tenuis TaxID=148309 RepID=A0AAD5M9X5_PARTN|nr:hypothetical protein KIN20_011745 [Parelaphostrongylus tenuis]